MCLLDVCGTRMFHYCHCHYHYHYHHHSMLISLFRQSSLSYYQYYSHSTDNYENWKIKEFTSKLIRNIPNRPDIELQRCQLILYQNLLSIRYKTLYDTILSSLAEATCEITEDISLIEILEKSKLDSGTCVTYVHFWVIIWAFSLSSYSAFCLFFCIATTLALHVILTAESKWDYRYYKSHHILNCIIKSRRTHTNQQHHLMT